MKQKAIVLLKELVRDIVEKNYNSIKINNRLGRLTIEELDEAIQEYGIPLVYPPDSAFENFDVYEVEKNKKYTIDFDMWDIEGEGDLTLQCEIYLNGDDVQISIDDLHVL